MTQSFSKLATVVKVAFVGAALIGLAAASSAYAGSSQGSGASLPIGVEGTAKVENYGPRYTAPAPVKRDPDGIVPLGEVVVPQTGWNPFGTVVLTAEELAAQQSTNSVWRRRYREQFVRNGGCNAEFKTVEQESWCWNRGADGNTIQPNPFPPVGASQGGSDSSD
jgi:hypothetical protein